jgi:hypothetical protein
MENAKPTAVRQPRIAADENGNKRRNVCCTDKFPFI